MTREHAFDLAQRKANDWNLPYRVLRSTEPGIQRNYTVEQSDSEDSPRQGKEWVLVEIFRPMKPAK